MKKVAIFIFLMVLIPAFTLIGAGCKEQVIPAEEISEEATGESEKEEEVSEETVEEAKPAEQVKEVTIGVSEAWTTLDVQNANIIETIQQLQLVYNGLLEFDKDLNFIPGLAEKWEVSEDGLEYTFYLRKGINFSNGREMVANDVKFSLERELGLIPPNTPMLYSSELGPVESIDIIDDYTVKVTLERPFSPFLRSVTSGQRPVLAPENYDADGNLIQDELIGTGPYKLVEIVLDDYAKFEKREDYWGGELLVDTVIFKQIPDSAVRLSALKSGDIDMFINPTPDDFLNYLDSPAEEYILSDIPGSTQWAYNICLNSHREPFDDLKVRQAIAHAIDVNEFIAIATSGLGKETTSAWAEGYLWHADVQRLEYNIEKAKQLLADAGYPDGFETTIHTTDFVKFVPNAEILQSQLAKIGITTTIENPEFATWAEREANADFDIHTCCWNFQLDPTGWYEYAKSDSGYPSWFAGGWADPELDDILNRASQIVDYDDRFALYNEANEYMVQNVVTLMIYTEPYLYGQNAVLEDFKWTISGDFIHSLNQGIPSWSYK